MNTATGTVTFQNAGTWYDYLNGNTFTATGTPQNITLQPGEFHLYLNRNVTNVVTTPVSNINNQPVTFKVNVYPNPLIENGILEIENEELGAHLCNYIMDQGKKCLKSLWECCQKACIKFHLIKAKEKIFHREFIYFAFL